MADMTVTIDAETQRFLAKYQKLISKNDELKQKLKDMGRSGRSSSREIAAGMDVVERGILSATKAVVGFVAGFATLGSAISMLQQIDERMGKIASLSSKSARGIQSFVQLQARARRN